MTQKADKKHLRKPAHLVSFDWIVFTAGVVGLAVVILASVQAGENGLAAQWGSYVITGSRLF